MFETAADQPHDADARRTALEIIATLVNVKKLAADQLLRPAGVPEPLQQVHQRSRRKYQ